MTRRHTLLVADDSITIQRVIELTFADEDIRVVAVSDGAAAIAALDQSPPDIVLADIGMPGQNGYDVARHVRTTPALAHIPVLLMTGAFEPVDHARMHEIGSEDVLTKPFEPQVVIARVLELLSRPTGAAAEQRAPAVEQASQAPVPARVTPVETEHYFDRLDAALLERAGTPRREPSQSFQAPEARAAAAVSENASPSLASVARGSLADAFAALLAAEQAGSQASSPSGWQAPPTTLPDAVIEEIVGKVTERVLSQLSDRVVRETVADIASASAERLVREEIERIKREIV